MKFSLNHNKPGLDNAVPAKRPEPAIDPSLANSEEIWIVAYEAPGFFNYRICLNEAAAEAETAKLSKTYRNVEAYKFEKVYQ